MLERFFSYESNLYLWIMEIISKIHKGVEIKSERYKYLIDFDYITGNVIELCGGGTYEESISNGNGWH